MRGKRNKGREYAMLALFSHFVGEGEVNETLELLYETRNPSLEVRDFAQEIVQGVLKNIRKIDHTLRQCLDQKWEFERIANLEKTVLRQALYEFFFTSTPIRVIVAESLILVDNFSTESSLGFINGVLGAIFTKLEKPNDELENELDDQQENESEDELYDWEDAFWHDTELPANKE